MEITNKASPVVAADGGSYDHMLSGDFGGMIWESRNGARINLSLNHPALTSVDAWLYEGVAGINLDEWDPAAPIVIAPTPVGPAAEGKYAAATLMSPRGAVSSRWEWTRGGTLTYTVTLPPGSSGLVSVIAQKSDRLALDGAIVRNAATDPVLPSRMQLAVSAGPHTLVVTPVR